MKEEKIQYYEGVYVDEFPIGPYFRDKFNKLPSNIRYDYSFNYDVVDNKIDYDLGMVLGWKLSKKFGVFFEARYLNMYNIQSYEAKSGFNWLIY